MEIDPSNITQTEEEKRRMAEKMCAGAFACQVYGDGVEWVSIRVTREGPGGYHPKMSALLEAPKFDFLVCMLAKHAWLVVFHSEEKCQKAIDTHHEVNLAIDGDLMDVTRPVLKDVAKLADDSEELEEAWEDAKRFVRDWSELIKHAASRLMDNLKELDEPALKGEEIHRYVSNPSAYGLERP